MTGSGLTRREEMAVVAARLLKPRERVLVGVGLPNLAANLAKRLHAPDLLLIYESGILDANPRTLPLSIGDPVLVRDALATISMLELFSNYLQTGWIDVGFLGGAQVDRRGNLNSTVIGPYEHPTVRMAGSGGAADIAACAQRLILVLPQDRRHFPAQVDFVTSPGHPPNGRRPDGRGPVWVVTDMGLYDFDDTGEMRLRALYRDATVKAVQAATGWPLRIHPQLTQVPPVSPDEYRALRALQAGPRSLQEMST